jgi:predicted O-methyltransferase YrrM
MAENPVSQPIRKAASSVPPLRWAYRKVRDGLKKDPLVTAVYRKMSNGSRLTLPEIAAEKLCPASVSIELPILYPLFAGEDAPLADLIFLLNLAKGRQAKRILEVGTYRARTTHALHLNCPDADIVSYDIQVLDSAFRRALAGEKKVELRHDSFIASAGTLRKEQPFDLIFVDGSHQFQHVVDDSQLALELVTSGGIVVWHDYRPNDHPFQNELRVPEALAILSQNVKVYAVPSTMCAVHSPTLK